MTCLSFLGWNAMCLWHLPQATVLCRKECMETCIAGYITPPHRNKWPPLKDYWGKSLVRISRAAGFGVSMHMCFSVFIVTWRESKERSRIIMWQILCTNVLVGVVPWTPVYQSMEVSKRRIMVLCFLSRTLQLARHSSSPLGRQLCSTSAKKPVLTLFTKFILQEVDITLPENSAWNDKYKYDIPVFHLNGKFLMKHRVDIKKFMDQLTELELQK
ncbi:glutaredoxin-like protein C5orf63 homolog isoform X2 [Neopelma chrysocephalum]|uniref:glutaredoxin-like protein C5orf63 homolog isoform X2 n=1 Tax=Neopelma chrysocephalum TaxID=114329 RepID=UPI000FCD3F3E|nr:glutaredoxin-like protein C5orf63 homolog isoform X2 [Neopelma chrysocephalum]